VVSVPAGLDGEAGSPVTVASLPARGRPPEAAARRAGLEFVEKLLPTRLTSTDTTERNTGMLRVPLVASSCRLATGLGFLVALVVIDVAQGRLRPSLQTVTLTAGLRLPQLEPI
jgi:hypothetical protein